MSPEWIATGEISDCVWRVALGERSSDHVDVVIDFDGHDGSPRGTSAFGTPLPLEGRTAAFVGGGGDGEQHLAVGVAERGASRMQLELSDGTARDALLVRLDEPPVDLYVATVPAGEFAVACLRHKDGDAVERLPFGSE